MKDFQSLTPDRQHQVDHCHERLCRREQRPAVRWHKQFRKSTSVSPSEVSGEQFRDFPGVTYDKRPPLSSPTSPTSPKQSSYDSGNATTSTTCAPPSPSSPEPLSAIGQITSDHTPDPTGRAATAVVMMPPGLVNRAARYLEAAANLVHEGVLPADFIAAHSGQLAAILTQDAAILRYYAGEQAGEGT